MTRATSTAGSCVRCTAQTADGITLCDRCRRTVERSLENIAADYAALDDVPTATVRRRATGKADPTAVAAAAIIRDPVTEIDDAVVNALSTWCRVLEHDRAGYGLRAPRAAGDMTRWVARHLATIVTLEWAGEMATELLALERRLRQVAARALSGSYVGKCGNVNQRRHDASSCSCSCHLGPEYTCDQDDCEPDHALPPTVCDLALYVPAGERLARCSCGAAWDATAKRQATVKSAEDELLPVAALAVLAALWLGEPSVERVATRIRKWVQRGWIDRATTKVIDGRSRPVYRVGDVLDLLTESSSTKSA